MTGYHQPEHIITGYKNRNRFLSLTIPAPPKKTATALSGLMDEVITATQPLLHYNMRPEQIGLNRPVYAATTAKEGEDDRNEE